MEIKDFKNYLKENKHIEKFFFTGLKENTIEKKYQYLKNHFNYDVLNPWNGLKTIANNVKIYNLGLTNEQEDNFFEINRIDPDFFDYLNNFDIEEFERLTQTKIYFNGRSRGLYYTLRRQNKQTYF